MPNEGVNIRIQYDGCDGLFIMGLKLARCTCSGVWTNYLHYPWPSFDQQRKTCPRRSLMKRRAMANGIRLVCLCLPASRSSRARPLERASDAGRRSARLEQVLHRSLLSRYNAAGSSHASGSSAEWPSGIREDIQCRLLVSTGMSNPLRALSLPVRDTVTYSTANAFPPIRELLPPSSSRFMNVWSEA